MKRKSPALEQLARLERKVLDLGGIIPPPEPWAIHGRRGGKVTVDLALRNLQLLELVEDLEKKHERNYKV